QEEITKGALTLSTLPKQGEELSFHYHQNKTSIAGEQPLKCILYYTVGTKVYAEDILLSDTGSVAGATFRLPDSAQSFALKFHTKHTDRNRGKGYVFPIYTTRNKTIQGALVGVGLFYNNRQSLLRLSQQPDTALYLLKKEFRKYPEEKNRWIS